MPSFDSLDRNEMCVCRLCKDEMSIWSFWKADDVSDPLGAGKVLKSCQLCRDLQAYNKRIMLERIIAKRKSWGHYKD